VGELAEDEIPRPQPGAQVGNGGEGEDETGPENDRHPG
jgi:hypothetical protein